ncbi:MAG: hypothetical protein GOU98_01455 [Candidatus Altiarchaeota archaeon]|nr:hypothetical protein [Candidatus Altiarchaeota archaeon]
MQQQPYAQAAYRAGYYPYPASYASYPTRTPPYGTQPTSKLLYPIIIALVGILLVGYNFINVEKLDPQLARLATISPDLEVAAVVFCDPCSAVQGDNLGGGKVMVVDDALSVKLIADLPGVKQVKLVGRV